MKRLLDETTWHGKALKPVVNAGKILFVLVFFFGLFVVIAVDSVIRRIRHRPVAKGATRT